MTKTKLLALVAIPVIVLAIFHQIFSSPDSSEEITDTLNAGFSSMDEIESTEISSADIYFDASGSMKAYFVSDDGGFSGQVSKLYECTNNRNIFLLGPKGNAIPYNGRIADIVDNLCNFNGGDTPFHKLLPMLSKKVSKGKVCFLVTDGIVYLNKNTSRALVEFQSILADSLKKSGGSNKGYAIFKFSAKFDGQDAKSGGICYYDMNNTPTALLCNDRPYYIIAVGEKEDIRRLKKEAAKKLKPEMALYFGLHNWENHAKGKQREDSTQCVISDEPLKLTVTLPSCLTDLYDVSPEYFKHANTQIKIGNKILRDTLDYNIVTNRSGNLVNMTVNLHANPTRGDGKLVVTTQNVIPEEWAALSLDDDTKIKQNMKKTFGLKYLLNGIMKAVGDDTKPLMQIQYEYKF